MKNELTLSISGREINFKTGESLFSPSAPDRGTKAMLRHACITPDDRVLDLGCGWGYVSAYACAAGAARVDACDLDPQAAAAARENLERTGFRVRVIESDGLDAVEACDYTLILSNPPYQSDFSVAKKFIAQGWAHLEMGGRLIMVTKRREWYKNRLIAVFGGVKIEEDDGYYIFIAEKRLPKPKREKNPQKVSKKLARKQARGGK